MRKIFSYNKIFLFAVVSFSLLFFALVGVGYIEAANKDCAVLGKGTGVCHDAALSCGSPLGTLYDDSVECATPYDGKCCVQSDYPTSCLTITSASCKTGLTCGTDSVAVEGSCTNSAEICCKPVATSEAPACDILNANPKTGRCQKATSCSEVISANPLCPQETPICCKPSSANSPTQYDYCATGTTGTPAPGGVCATACTGTTPQNVTSQIKNNECAATSNPLCCAPASAAAADTTAGQTPPTTGSDIPEEAGYFAKALAWLISALIWLGGSLLLAVVELIVRVSQFNRIINSYFVVQGWIVLRDLVNMFFVLGLLFIAFVTVLKIERYQWQKLLPKLLIMAVVVNFSRTICGLMIDFFQVMMFSFVNAYKDIAGENLFKGLGLRDMWDSNTPGAEMGGTYLILGRLLGLIYVIVALIVTVIFLVILVFRIIVLWVLVVFSPLAFFSAAFSGISGKIGSYWNKWFSMFIEYCMVGPLLAFFLWLSILSIGSDYTTQYSQEMSPAQSVGQSGLEVTQNKAGRLDYIMKFVLGILMLVVGLKFTSEMKVIGASYAGKAATKIQGAAYASAARLAKTGVSYVGEPLASRAYRGDLGWVGKQLAPQTWRDRGTLVKGAVTGFVAGEPGRAREAQEQVLKKKTEAYDRSKKYISAPSLDALFKKAQKDKDWRTMDYAIQGLADAGGLTSEHAMIVQSGGFNEKYLKNEDLKREYEKKTSKKNKTNGGQDFFSSNYKFDDETQSELPPDPVNKAIETLSKDKRGVLEDKLDNGLIGNAGTVNSLADRPDEASQKALVKVVVGTAVGNLAGADMNSNTDLLSNAIHKKTGKQSQFLVADRQTREKMFKDDPTLVSDVFGYKNPGEDDKQHEKRALDYYDSKLYKDQFKAVLQADVENKVPEGERLIDHLNSNIARANSKIDAGSGTVSEAGFGLAQGSAGIESEFAAFLPTTAPQYHGKKGRKNNVAGYTGDEDEEEELPVAPSGAVPPVTPPAPPAPAEPTERERRNAERERDAEERRRQYEEGGFDFDDGTSGSATPTTPPPAPPAPPEPPAPPTPPPAPPTPPATPPAAPAQNDIVVNQAVTMVNNSINNFSNLDMSSKTANADLGQAFGAIVRNFNTNIADLEKTLGGKFSSQLADLKKQMSDIGTKFYDPSNPNAAARKSDAEAGFASLRKNLENLKKSNS